MPLERAHGININSLYHKLILFVMSKAISDQIEKTKMLLDGIRKNTELVKNKGLNEEFASRMEANIKMLGMYDEELDKLKEGLKSKTIQSNKKIMEIKSQIKDAKRVIKRDFPKEEWKKFNIMDKR